MKVLPAEVKAWLENQPNIAPCFLIEVELDETLYLSSRQEFTYGGITYQPGRIVGDIQISQDDASFGIINESYKYTTPALTGVYQRAPVKIWWSEGAAVQIPIVDPGYFEDLYYTIEERRAPILLFDGNISNFDQITSVLGVVASRSAARRYPTLRVLPPVANYVAPEGAVFTLNGNTYRLESRN